ncbi:MAG TPA: hypothetical protein VF489_07955 [Sphingobium sp.]
MKYLMFVAALFAASTTAQARQRTVIEDLPKEIVDNNHVASVEIVIADTARQKFEKLEAKAAEKRAETKLAAYDPTTASPHPAQEEYATLPFEVMFPLVMQDVTHNWGLTEGKGVPLKLRITVEGIKTANAAMAILISSSSDELAGKVDIFNAAGDQSIGSFYVHVVNSHGGWGGMLMRGSGVREKLAQEFALESARILTGSTKKDWKKRVKAREKAGQTSIASATAN